MSSPVPATRGLRVDHRVHSVDMLENVISLGQLQQILRATLLAAALEPGNRMVDVGCGSGKLVIEAARLVGAGLDTRQGHALGIDATPGMIDLARERGRTMGSSAQFKVGVAEALPLADTSVDAVTSSYFFHHLPGDVKPQALDEMWRVLAPGGRLVITDYGPPYGLPGWLASIPMRLNFHEHVRAQLAGELERIIGGRGIGPVEVVHRFLGYITVWRIVKPG